MDRRLHPTEILRAWVGGPVYLRPGQGAAARSAAGPDRRVGLEEIGRYLDTGALAVGLGGPLVGDAGKGGDLGPLRRRAHAAVAQVREAHAR
jgi:2-dehydro-3-deoxyphosphogluconate aldolase/(4S)-4-hydroxy-2-oxoglutarate aldolase